MTPAAATGTLTAFAFLVNLPFGWWRAGLRKLSPAWFLAVHAAVPLVIGVRLSLGLPFRWLWVPLYAAAYFSGQAVGARLRARAAGPPRPRRAA